MIIQVSGKNIDINEKEIKKNLIRLINQIWKLIPMREHKENWKEQLNVVILEITGLNVIFNAQYLQLLSKLEGLKEADTTFEFYRKTIFECISLLNKL